MLSIAIGDIHGMAEKLDQLLLEIDVWRSAHHPGAPCRLIFLRDYVDRGPDARGVLERMRALEQDGAICLRGNHEALMISAPESDLGMQTFVLNGGNETIRSLRTLDAFVEAVAWMASLPLSFDDERRFFVHAGIRPGVPLPKQREKDLLWIRKPFLTHPGPFPTYVVHGHSPTLRLPGHSRRPQVFSHRCNLDTGAVFGGPLSAAVFTDEQTTPIAILTTEGCVPISSDNPGKGQT